MALTTKAKEDMLVDVIKTKAVRIWAIAPNNEVVSSAHTVVWGNFSTDKIDISQNIEIDITSGKDVNRVLVTEIGADPDLLDQYIFKNIGATESFPFGGKLIILGLEVKLPDPA